MLGVLGLAPLPELPLNDKALHFFGVSGPAPLGSPRLPAADRQMGFAAFLTYFVLEVPE